MAQPSLPVLVADEELNFLAICTKMMSHKLSQYSISQFCNLVFTSA